MTAPLRIANCSGFYGDRLSAAREMVTGGPIDFLTGDYLAELTMMILWKSQQKDPAARLRRHLPQADGRRAGRGAVARREDRHQRRRPQPRRAHAGTAQPRATGWA